MLQVYHIGSEHLHSRLEELVETVHALHELQSDARDEQFLQLLNDEAPRVEPDNQSGEETARSDHDVKHVPPVRAITRPAKAEETDDNVHTVHDGDEDEEVVYQWTPVSSAQGKTELGLTAELVEDVLRGERLCHQGDDMQSVQHGHHPRPPAMLVNGTVIAPLTDAPCWSLLRTL